MDADSVHTKGDSPALSPAVTPPTPETQTPESAPLQEEREIQQASSPEPQSVRNDNQASETPLPQPNSAGLIVLQWLTYAFWGWLILGLLWLMGSFLSNVILGESVNESVPYAIAATVVLLPLAFLCDHFYRKHEPVKKTGAASVIMIIHAVLFALLGIGSLIIAAFTGINALINIDRSIDSQIVALLLALFAALLYAGAFVRALNPFKTKKPSLLYSIVMLVLTLSLLAAAVAGPVVSSIATRTDRLIERSLPDVQSAIEVYITDNNKLPSSLSDVPFNDPDARKLVEDNLVEYVAVGTVNRVASETPGTTLAPNLPVTYRYQLCVEYKAANNTSSGYSRYSDPDDGGYSTYLSTYHHDAGRTCYKLQQSVYGNEY